MPKAELHRLIACLMWTFTMADPTHLVAIKFRGQVHIILSRIFIPSYPGYSYPRTPDIHTLVPRIFMPSYPLVPWIFMPSYPLVPRIFMPSYPLLPRIFMPSLPLVPRIFMPSYPGYSCPRTPDIGRYHSLFGFSYPTMIRQFLWRRSISCHCRRLRYVQ